MHTCKHFMKSFVIWNEYMEPRAWKTFSSYSNLEVQSCLDQLAVEHESIVLNNFSLVLTLLA